MVWKGPVIAWEIVSTGLISTNGLGKEGGVILSFCMLTSEHRTGRHPGRLLFCASHRESLVSPSEPRSLLGATRTSGPVWALFMVGYFLSHLT